MVQATVVQIPTCDTLLKSQKIMEFKEMKKLDLAISKNTSSLYIFRNINLPPKQKLPLHCGRKGVSRIHFQKSDISKNNKE